MSPYFTLTLITEHRHPAADQGEQSDALETVRLRGLDVDLYFI